MTDEMARTYDVVVIGGGAAGLGGALMLGRSRRSVVVIDAGSPRNAPAAGVHGFLTRDGISPGALLETGRAEVRHYGGHVVDGEATAVAHDDDGFAVTLADGRVVGARRLLVTTGLVDELPDVPGLREQWGHDVIHCPYCHGWEVRDQPIGVLALGPTAVHQALLFRQLSADITVFGNDILTPSAEEAEQFAARGIRFLPGRVRALESVGGRLAGVRLDDDTLVTVAAVAVAPRFVARSGILADLGLKPVEHPRGMGEYVPADPTGLTAVPGVWVAGNVADLSAQVATSAAGGALAGAMINADLIAEDTRLAVEAHRADRPAATRPVSGSGTVLA